MTRFLLAGVATLLAWGGEANLDRLAKVLAFLEWHIFRLRKNVVIKNLKIVADSGAISPDQIEEIGKTSVYHIILTFLEFLYSFRRPFDMARVEVGGKEHLDKALELGKGVYILCAHLGNWEYMGAAYTQLLCPAHVIVKKVGSDSTDRFVNDLRRSNQFLPITKRTRGNVVRDIFRVLRKNEVVGFILDQARPGSPKLPFFSMPAKTNTSLATLWHKAPAPIVPSYSYRTGVNRLTIVCLPQVPMRDTGDREADILFNSMQFNKILEGMICLHPEQYFWMHNRWKP